MFVAQSDILRAYIPRSYPTLNDPPALDKFITDQLQQISVSIATLVQVVKQIDARLLAHVPPI